MKQLFTFVLLFQFIAVFCQPVLVKDIQTGSAPSLDDYEAESLVIGNTLFFVANDGVTGDELWKSDGSAAGTVLVKDINSGISTGAAGFYTDFNGQLFFGGDDPANGFEVWKSDGTEAGTVLLRDACSGTCDGPYYGYNKPEFAEYNGKLYFLSEGSGIGQEIWSTDGTAAGTALAVDVYPGFFSSDPGNMHVHNGKLYFSGNSFDYGAELFVTDGTSAGTQLVKDTWTGPFAWGGASNLISLGNIFFYVASDGTHGRELWKSDGTTNGTSLVKDIFPDSGNGIGDVSERAFIVFNNKLFFTAKDGTSGNEIWSTDGTEAGTQKLKDIASGGANVFGGFLGVLNGKLIFNGFNGTNGDELWSTDGTASGTVLLKDIFPGFIGSSIGSDAFIHNDRMFFKASDGVIGSELWITDGTASGTILLADINPAGSSAPSNFHVIGDNLYFFAQNSVVGRELWKLALEIPTAALTVSADTACPQEILTFNAIPASGNTPTYQWTFGAGAQPLTAQGVGPHNVKYSTAGNKTVRLITSNPFGRDTAFQTITVLSLPVANFSITSVGQTATFNNTSINAVTYLWDFGDGNTSTEEDPTHHYAAPGTYTVKLTASNQCQTVQKSVSITLLVGTDELPVAFKTIISPNPSNGDFKVELSGQNMGAIELNLFDVQGVLKGTIQLNEGERLASFKNDERSKGIYFLHIKTKMGTRVLKVLQQ
ncbi:MAG: PKD domain-containing protein [Phycisphaerae bacterium]|nr:PKD domain-containing protein [Saprospiraceae bacterium]